MDELGGVRKSEEGDEDLRNRLMKWCYEYWEKVPQATKELKTIKRP